jgi:hypothetical protein
MQVSEFHSGTKVENSTCDYGNIYPTGPTLLLEINDIRQQTRLKLKNC